RHVDPDSVPRQALARLEAGRGHRDLDYGLGALGRKHLALLVHWTGLGLGGLEGDVSVDLIKDFLPGLVRVLVLTGNEGRVRGHALQDAPLVDLADLLDVGGVEKQPHTVLSSCTPAGFLPASVLSVARSMIRSMIAASD